MTIHGTTLLHIPNDNRQRSHQLARTKDGHDRSSILTTTPEMSIKTRRGAGSSSLNTSKSPLQTAQTLLITRDTQGTTRSHIRSRILSASSRLQRSLALHLYRDHRTTVPVENSPGWPTPLQNAWPWPTILQHPLGAASHCRGSLSTA